MVSIDGVVISLIPDCSDIIAVNSIHPLIRVEDNIRGCIGEDLSPLNEHLYRDDDKEIAMSVLNPPQVEYDGMTVRLRLHALVTPGVHSVRIVIADVDDGNWDCALVLREGSLRTVPPAP
jgi:hypothetical protein